MLLPLITAALLLSALTGREEDQDDRDGRRSACADAVHRQFDFWVGDWEVHNRAGVFIAENRITLELDGCVVAEHWTPLHGGRGRSISSYDARTGQWRQTWVTEALGNSYPLRLAGGLRPDDAMEMKGVRHPYWGRDLVWLDDYIWTPLSPDQVVQEPIFDLPSSGIHFAGRLTYLRNDALPPVDSQGTDKCTAGDSSDTRRLDFALGSWRVIDGRGKHVGKSEIVLDPTLSSCLLEEHLKGEERLRAIGWLYYDAVEDRFYRMLVDNRGDRVEVGGQFDASGALVLVGPSPDAPPTMRLTVNVLDRDRFQLDWARSEDGGLTWNPERTLVYVRQETGREE